MRHSFLRQTAYNSTRIMHADTLHLLIRGTKAYKRPSSSVPVFSEFSLSIPRGQCLAIMGPNACGKSTVARIVLGIENLDAGEVGINLTPHDLAAAVLQNYRKQLLPWASISDNILLPFGGDHAPDIPKTEALQRAQLFLAEAGYDLAVERPIYSLSGGQQQAVVISRALLYSPAIWILDEAFSAIDLTKRERICTALSRYLTDGRSTLFITHDIDDALRISNRLALFDTGMKLLHEVTVDRSSPQEAFIESASASSIRAHVRESMRERAFKEYASSRT